MDVSNEKYAYIHEITCSACERMHQTGKFELRETYLLGLKSNQTTSRPVTLVSNVDNTGICSGNAYSDPYGNWIDVVVLATLQITLEDYVADVKINSDHLQLKSAVYCKLSDTALT